MTAAIPIAYAKVKARVSGALRVGLVSIAADGWKNRLGYSIWTITAKYVGSADGSHECVFHSMP